jgi:ferredoxin
MRVQVDRGVCQSHGQCAIAAPGVFRIVDDVLEYDPEPSCATDGERDEIESAADVCPTGAITLED